MSALGDKEDIARLRNVCLVAYARLVELAIDIRVCSTAPFPDLHLFALERGNPFSVERFDSLSKIVRLPQPAVAMPFQLDRNRKR